MTKQRGPKECSNAKAPEAGSPKYRQYPKTAFILSSQQTASCFKPGKLRPPENKLDLYINLSTNNKQINEQILDLVEKCL